VAAGGGATAAWRPDWEGSEGGSGVSEEMEAGAVVAAAAAAAAVVAFVVESAVVVGTAQWIEAGPAGIWSGRREARL